MNGYLLSLYPHNELATDATVKGDRSNFRGFTLAYNTSSPSQVDRVLDLLNKLAPRLPRSHNELLGADIQAICLIPMIFFGKLPLALLWTPK